MTTMLALYLWFLQLLGFPGIAPALPGAHDPGADLTRGATTGEDCDQRRTASATRFISNGF